jgi:hypothetical protein
LLQAQKLKPISEEQVVELVLGNAWKLECVDRFCYLGDMLEVGGGVEEATKARVKCAWGKFRELIPILTARGASLKVKGKLYRACVQSVVVYGSETWATKVTDMHWLCRAETMTVRWMCGVSLKDRRSSRELLDRLGIVGVAEVVRRGRLRWYGHVERKKGVGWVSKCRDLTVAGFRGNGRPRKTWEQCVVEDMRVCGLRRADAQKRGVWRKGIHGTPSEPAQARNNRR